jgi:NHL repeat
MIPKTETGYGGQTTIYSGYPNVSPVAVAVDAAGDVYFADPYNNRVVKMPLVGTSYGSLIPIGSGLNFPMGVAVDGTGNLYIADSSNNRVVKLPWNGTSFGTQTTVGSGLYHPESVAVDGRGNVYIADTYNGRIVKVDVADAPSLNFPTSTEVGTTDTTDGPRTVNILNIGNQPLVFSDPSTGTNPSYPANFPANTGDGNFCSSATPLGVGATCDVSANFMPTGGGANSGSVVLTDNAAKGTQNIALTGTGVGTQIIAFTPPSSVIYGVSPITLVATGGDSGNPVMFSVLSGPGTVSGANGSTLTITGVGTVVVAANQAGSADYTAAQQVTGSITVLSPPATLASPAPSTVLAGPKVTFAWTTVPGATSYIIRLGTTAGATDVYSSGVTTATSVTPTNLPTNGETIYATLYTYYGSAQVSNSYTFTATAPAALSAPASGSVLTGPSVTFNWTAATGPGVTGYIFQLGTTAGGNNVYSSGLTTATSVTRTNLPTNGETIYATLKTNYGSVQVTNSYTFTAANAAALTSPTGGSTLSGPGVTFNWTTATGAGVTGYRFWLGTTAGTNNIYASGSTTATSATDTKLPTNGETIYATLYTFYGSATVSNSYTFTASTP